MMLANLQSDGLSLEYKLNDGCAIGNLCLSDIVDNPMLLRVCGIAGSGFEEQLFDFVGGSRNWLVVQ